MICGLYSWCLTELSTLTKSQWYNLKSWDGFLVLIMGEIWDAYWVFSCSKNDYFGFSASLLGAMSSALKFCVDLASSTFVLAAWRLRSYRRSCEGDVQAWDSAVCWDFQLHKTFLALQLHPVANALPDARSWQEPHPGYTFSNSSVIWKSDIFTELRRTFVAPLSRLQTFIKGHEALPLSSHHWSNPTHSH